MKKLPNSTKIITQENNVFAKKKTKNRNLKDFFFVVEKKLEEKKTFLLIKH